MKIKSLKISNVVSFKYYNSLDDCPGIQFKGNMNILIGQNGSGKSTVVEVLNFIFKKVLFQNYMFNNDIYTSVNHDNQIQQVISKNHGHSSRGFRLEPNWNTEDKPRKLQIVIQLDDIDKANLKLLNKNSSKLEAISNKYSKSNELFFDLTGPYSNVLELEITLEGENYTVSLNTSETDIGYLYLQRYNYFRELISLYNLENNDKQIEFLSEPFSLLGSYRNYNVFTPAVSLGSSPAIKQIQDLKGGEFQKSTNNPEPTEPSIFNWVRLRLAQKHFDLWDDESKDECERLTNQEPFLVSINKRLRIVDLEVRVRLVNKNNWGYAFDFINLKTGRTISNINSLSAGQRSILHLIFEAYGRGDLKGGLVLIDEPEIHLHHQFQFEYLQVIKEINKDQHCQYIIVTHSESFITSETIHTIQRFALDKSNYTIIKSPTISTKQKSLIKILDNSRSTFAFFAQKVILVEGDTDRYFYRAVLNELHPELSQEIAILDMGGKGNYNEWNSFFSNFGLQVFFIGDFDNVFTLKHDGTPLVSKSQKSKIEEDLRQEKLNSITRSRLESLKAHYNKLIKSKTFLSKPQLKPWSSLISHFRGFLHIEYKQLVKKTKDQNPSLNTAIEDKYQDNIYILKLGTLETYMSLETKDLENVITFCQNDLSNWLGSLSQSSKEIKMILKRIVG